MTDPAQLAAAVEAARDALQARAGQSYLDQFNAYTDAVVAAVTGALDNVPLAEAAQAAAETARDAAQTAAAQAQDSAEDAAAAIGSASNVVIPATDRVVLPSTSLVAVHVYDRRRDTPAARRALDAAHLHTSWGREPRPAGQWLGARAGEAAARDAGGGDGDYYYDEGADDFRELTGSSGTQAVDRGARRSFPTVAIITAETDRVVIWDGDDPDVALWMVFRTSTTNMAGVNDANMAQAVAAGQGRLWIGAVKAHSPDPALTAIDFLADRGYGWLNSISRASTYSGPVTARNDSLGFVWGAPFGDLIGDHPVNAVAATVLPQTPADPATGVEPPTVAVATAGGVSVIHADGQVADVTGVAAVAVDIELQRLKLGHGSAVEAGPIPYSDEANTAWREVVYQTNNPSSPVDPISAADISGITAAAVSQRFADGGLTHLAEDPVEPANGMVAYTTHTYATGWLPGDVRLALSATDPAAGGASEPDRSGQGHDATIHGAVTREAVATGADLVAWRGFSAADVLATAFSTGLNVTGGDFAVMAWLSWPSGVGGAGVAATVTDGTLFARIQESGSDNLQFAYDYGAGFTAISSNLAHKGTGWRFVTIVQRGNRGEVWVDGVLCGSGAMTPTPMGADPRVVVGDLDVGSGTEWKGAIALPRVTAHAPTPEQIRRMYADERPLFQADAKALLGGTSTDVRALDHDPVSGRLAVGTADGVSVFHGLQRLAYHDASGSLTSDSIQAVAVGDGRLVLASDAEAVVQADSRNVQRDIERAADAANHDPARVALAGRTTDATAEVAIGHLPVGEGERLALRALVRAERGAAATYEVRAGVSRAVGGDVVLEAASTTVVHESATGLDATVTVDTGSQTAVVAVTGLAGATIGWMADVEVSRG